MALKTIPFDAANYLDSPEAIEAFLADAFATSNIAEIMSALGAVARARGMSQLAADTDLSRPALYRALGPEGNPTLDTLLKVMRTLGLRLAPVHLPPTA